MTLFSLSWIHQGTTATPSPTPATSRIDLAFGNTFMVFVIFCLAFQFYRVRQFLHEKWPATFESDPSLTPPASPPLKCKCTLYYALDMLSPLLSQPFSQVQHNTICRCRSTLTYNHQIIFYLNQLVLSARSGRLEPTEVHYISHTWGNLWSIVA